VVSFLFIPLTPVVETLTIPAPLFEFVPPLLPPFGSHELFVLLPAWRLKF
jgi:hypothetical protein